MIPASKKIRLILELRQGGIMDTALLAAMETVPRDQFVPDAFRDRAYEDTALPISHGQTISQPLIVAKMLQALELNDRVKVLEIGTGSGYQTMILSHLSRRVYTIERHRELLREAESRFDAMGRHNITTRAGDGWLGWPEQTPFTHIVVSAAADEIPTALTDQLAVGGVMIIPVGDERREQRIIKVLRTEDGFDVDDIGPVRFLPLVAGMPEAPGRIGQARA
ncbi:MAG: protein-L-isoaspartate(D-aspartate) O-methyltransferase [Rhodospirillaceae bacterium]|nr:protein-L-isoaspartate(D-aspartate) O-methyltransferase [Rhodospirillaceae bacterium]MDD9916797.1 protein-L-isoaspartate(D-aspartate) O-methyltransferase [Rhodospirillaceae bacterium]MDD9926562.1 protein-L-isoaspartate(D-aspartate) O-methyltransferase [Rhodospirillaceae bacterium]